MAGGNPVTEAVMDAVASKIRGATTDMKAMAAGLSGVYADTAYKADKFFDKADARWEKKADAMKARGVGPTDKEYIDALALYQADANAAGGFKTTMLQLATRVAQDAIDD